MEKRNDNLQTQKQQYDAIINAFGDKSQLEGTTNKINERAMAENPPTPRYVVNKSSKEAYDAATKGDASPIVLPENTRFSREIPINEAELRQNKHMRLNQKVDAVAEGKTK